MKSFSTGKFISEKVTKPKISRKLRRRLTQGAILSLLMLALWFFYTNLPVTYQDWENHFRPAALRWYAPYKPGIFNPPWTFLILHPLALLPHPAGVGLFMLISTIIIAWYAGSPKKLLLIALSAPVINMMTLGQLDALLLLGLMIPNGLGIPFLLIKPQGAFLAIIPRLNRRSVLLTAAVIAASVVIWGFWWMHIIGQEPAKHVNMSFFPYSILPGVGLAYLGFKRRSDALLCFASLCFAPYFMMQSALPGVAAAIRETDDWRWWTVVVLGSWIYLIVMRVFLGVG